jgi:imidazolonepropionase-like amidohydrolase
MKACIQVDRVIGLDGTGSPPASIAIDEGGLIFGVDAMGNEPANCRLLDRRGCTALPLFADCHVHLGISNDVVESPDFHRLDLIDGQLRNYLECGIGHVHSLGTDQPWLQQELDRRRAANDFKQVAIGYSAGTGFGALRGWPGELTVPVPRFRPATPEEARQQVGQLAKRGARTLKIWVDDFGGRMPKLELPIADAIIDEARRHGITTFAHIFFLKDAAGLVEAGIDVLAHSIRDTQAGPQLAEKIAEKGVILAPTLAREDAELAFAQEEDNPYFQNPLFQKAARNRLNSLQKLRTDETRTLDELSRKRDLALMNFQTLTGAGVKVCLGTDSGFKMKLGGFSQHRELELMCSAGFAASASLQAALGNNRKLFAEHMTPIAPGERASFFLVKGNPLQSISDTQNVSEVWFEGEPLAL